LRKIILFIRTVRHLSFVQITNRVWRKLIPTKIDVSEGQHKTYQSMVIAYCFVCIEM